MKASIEQTKLLKSMARVQSIVERRTTIPILSNVLLEAKESFLYLRTTDPVSYTHLTLPTILRV